MKFDNTIQKIKNASIDVFAPYFCVECFKILHSKYLCAECFKKTGFSIGIYCIKCDKRRPLNDDFLRTCCSTSLKSLISFENYENEVISKLILLGKFKKYFEIFKFFGDLIAEELSSIKNSFKEFYLVPVPLHKKEEKERGFNQAKILVDILSKNLGIQISDCLVKTKLNKPQRTLSEQQRTENIKSVFEIKINLPKKIILVDDIKTTGATLLEAAKVLKLAGAKNIIGLTIVK